MRVSFFALPPKNKAMPKGQYPRPSLTELLRRKVDRSGGPDACWPWLRRLDRDGYGQFWLEGRVQRSHRVALLLSGKSPAEEALHTCDNRACCNPAHLRDGTQAENMTDMHVKGRGKAPDRKLDEAQRAELRALGGSVPLRALGRRFGVSKTTVAKHLSK